VLWCLGSDADTQKVLASLAPEELAQPAAQFQLGIRLIAYRSYAAAAAALSRAERLPSVQEDAFRLRLYALCMAGQRDEADKLAGTQTVGKAVIGTPFWDWLQKTCLN